MTDLSGYLLPGLPASLEAFALFWGACVLILLTIVLVLVAIVIRLVAFVVVLVAFLVGLVAFHRVWMTHQRSSGALLLCSVTRLGFSMAIVLVLVANVLVSKARHRFSEAFLLFSGAFVLVLMAIQRVWTTRNRFSGAVMCFSGTLHTVAEPSHASGRSDHLFGDFDLVLGVC